MLGPAREPWTSIASIVGALGSGVYDTHYLVACGHAQLLPRSLVLFL